MKIQKHTDMKLLKLAICILLLGGISASCTKEDHTDCHNIYRLDLRYNGDGTNDIFSQKITSVDMYVFDVNSNCVSSKRFSAEDMQVQGTVLPPLGEGEYRIVCIGNAYDTKVQGLDSRNLGNVTFAANGYFSGERVSGNDSLYWAAINYSIAPYDEYKQIESRTAYFKSSHYDVKVELKDHTGTMGENPVIELVGVTPQTNFHNEVQGSAASYTLGTMHDGDITTTAAANIMRHTNHEDVNLVITSEDGNTTVQVNFAEYLARYSNVIDTQKQECLIPVSVEIKDILADVKIQVPAWFVEIITPEFERIRE